MNFIKTKDELIKNIMTLENYLLSNKAEEQKFAKDLIRRGKTILVYKVNGENHFAPSRFLGYKNNSIDSHIANHEKDGRETNPEIDRVLKVSSFANEKTETKFLEYALSLGVEPDNNKRRYWRLKDSRGKNLDLKFLD